MTSMIGESEIFVPGRLCILGEHTDWAAEYSKVVPDLGRGYTLVCATNQGIYARVSLILHEQVLEYQHGQDINFKISFDVDTLQAAASVGDFYSYIAGTTFAILQSEKYKDAITSGLRIYNYHNDLPMKKGLSSSAAVCVLVVLAFQSVFSLSMSTADVMELAYQGEMLTPSRCGRMDQCVVMGAGAIGLMEFTDSGCSLEKIKCFNNLHFVVADLNAKKETIVILRELDSCFPHPQDETQALMHEYVREMAMTSAKARLSIETGDINGLAEAMNTAQTCFDRCAMPNCPSELTSPKLHQLMADTRLREMSLAIKGVGSQGDGSVQLLCRNKEDQELILGYVREHYGMEGFSLTIPGTGGCLISINK